MKMSSLLAQCKSDTDPNNNSPSPKSYSLRPRGSRMGEEHTSDPGRPKRTKKMGMGMSKYRRKTANARERCRMREINEAFETLRRVVPQMTSRDSRDSRDSRECPGEKPTKISTLRLAIGYISALRNLLRDPDLETDAESMLGDYALSLTSPDSHDGKLSLVPLRDGDCPLESFVAPSLGFDDDPYLLDDGFLFVSELG